MVKWLNGSFCVLLVCMIAALYHIRYSAEDAARALKKIERAIAQEARSPTHIAGRMVEFE